MAIEKRDVSSFREYLAATFAVQKAHKGARLFAAGGAIRQGDEETAREHLNALVDLPLSEQPSVEEWILNLGFPMGQMMVARLLKDKGESEAGLRLLEASLHQAKGAENDQWIEVIVQALSTFGVSR